MNDDLMNRISPDPLANYRAAVANRFVSLWDMLQLQAKSFLSSMALLGSAVGNLRMTQQLLSSGTSPAARMPLATKAQIVKAVEIVLETCEQHDLKISAARARHCHEVCMERLSPATPMSIIEIGQVLAALEGLINVVIDEAEDRTFYALSSRADVHHRTADDLFGRDVVDAFPAAVFDLEEAGRCLAFELWTAAVMHLMRALEPALGALANHVGLEAGANWNQTLDQIEKALRDVRRRELGAEAEEWASEAGAQLRFIKNAWRNSAMHGGTKYDEREARGIFETTRSLLQHLAEKIGSA